MQPQEPLERPPSGQPAPPAVHPDYSFIMSPESQKKPVLIKGLGGGSMLTRIAVVCGGLVLLVILYVVASNLLSGSKDYVSSFTAVAAEQQELIHIVGATTSSGSSTAQVPLSATNTNTAATIQLAVSNSQAQLLAYLKTNGQKVNPALLNAKISTATDQTLANSITAGTYDATFDSVIAQELNSYMQSLKIAYAKAPGAKGRAMLTSDYNQAQLMLTQVSAS